MSHKKNKLIFSLLLVLLLGIVPVAQAAPPAQEDTQDDSSLGETLDLDGVEEEETDGTSNLGGIMSDKNSGDETDGDETDGDETDGDETDGDETDGDETDGDETDGDETNGDETDGDETDGDETDGDETDGDETNGDETDGDETDGDETDGDETDGDETDGDETDGDETDGDETDGDETDGDETDGDETDGDETDGDETGKHPVASALAEYFEVEYDEIMSIHEDGVGFGVITKAYFFAEQLSMTPEELLQEGQTSGWGNALKNNGIHPGSTGNGGGKWSKNGETTTSEATAETGEVTTQTSEQAGPPGKTKKNSFQDTAGSYEFVGQGHGKDNGQGGKVFEQGGKGNGGGKGKASGDNGGGNGKGGNGKGGNGGGHGKGKK